LTNPNDNVLQFSRFEPASVVTSGDSLLRHRHYDSDGRLRKTSQRDTIQPGSFANAPIYD
jgi:hypothetical protein